MLKSRVTRGIIHSNKLRLKKKLSSSSFVDSDLSNYFGRVDAVSGFGSGAKTESVVKAAVTKLVQDLKACNAWYECQEIHLFAGPTNLLGAVEKLKYVSVSSSTITGLTDGNYTAVGVNAGINVGLNNNIKYLDTGHNNNNLVSGRNHISAYTNGSIDGYRPFQAIVGAATNATDNHRLLFALDRYAASVKGVIFHDANGNFRINANNGNLGDKNFLLAQPNLSYPRLEVFKGGNYFSSNVGAYKTSRNFSRNLYLFAENDGGTPENGFSSRVSFISYGGIISNPYAFYEAFQTYKNTVMV